jgi:hypothetical protein
MKRIALTLGVALTLIGGVAALAIVPAEPLAVSGSTATHVLYVDGTPYNHTQESGPVIHFETGPIEGGEDVTFPERDQVWEGNGSDNLPCEFGAHWVSNANLLTLSHCLEDDSTTSSSSTTSSTTTTTTVPASTTSTTAPGQTTTTAPAGSTTTTTTIARGVTPTPQAAPPVTPATTAAPTALPETE